MHRNKIGLDVALEALKDVRAQRKATADDLWRYAKICRVANVAKAQGVDFNQVLFRFALERRASSPRPRA